MDFLRRVPVTEDDQFTATIFYIHKNSVHHGIVKQIPDWDWSSYNAILSGSASGLSISKVLEWFDGLPHFISYHQQPIELKKAVIIE